jgi:hypothetical protein
MAKEDEIAIKEEIFETYLAGPVTNKIVVRNEEDDVI